MKYECTSCGRPVELDANGQFARNHRKLKGVRGAKWCDGSGRAKQFLKEISNAQS